MPGDRENHAVKTYRMITKSYYKKYLTSLVTHVNITEFDNKSRVSTLTLRLSLAGVLLFQTDIG